MILIIDNYDSFTYNLVQYFGELGSELLVRRNDQVSLGEIRALAPEKICLSPGPGRPENAGMCNDIIQEFGSTVPVLGVCLGLQCIGAVFGGEIIGAPQLMHGKSSLVRHNATGIFADLPNPMETMRYHSLVVRRETLPDSLQITAETEGGEIMALQHRQFPIHGVQFHPESIGTPDGLSLLRNFLRL
ncbi:MAG: aminodeoxychorismate/anthranilate synthase component II [Verrucomicrobiota bacterium]|nr:aminodeoxychorismate/anthranilate synthase component II [Verrucomicrobiota bacterium]